MVFIRARKLVLLVVSIILVAVGGFWVVLLAADSTIVSELITRREHDAIVEALESQIDIIKWIGGVIVTSLSACVAVLWRTLDKSNNQIRADLCSAAASREKLIETSVATLSRLSSKIEGLQDDIKVLTVELSGREDEKLQSV